MFIISKKSFKFRFADKGDYEIQRDYMGNVPDHVAAHPLFKLAVKGGDIVAPDTTSDKEIYRADDAAAKAQEAHDIRPDAPKKTRKK